MASFVTHRSHILQNIAIGDVSNCGELHFQIGKTTNILTRKHRYSSRPSDLFFASLSASTVSRSEACTRQTFDQIDVHGKGHITEADLEAYASAHGLPPLYAKHFTATVLSEAGGRSGEVGYNQFRGYVQSRETALRHAFELFDQDRDGLISVGDLSASLCHVSVQDPVTRCVYRCRATSSPSLDFVATHCSSATGLGDMVNFCQFRKFFLLLPHQTMMAEYWLTRGRCPDLDQRIVMHDSKQKGSPWGHLLAGAVAGAASRTATAPLETLRLAAMAGTLKSANLLSAAQHIVEGQGWRALYRGNAVNVMRSAPQKALDFLTFDLFKQALGAEQHPLKTFTAAGLAGAVSWVALYPLEVVRSRITCGTLKDCKNVVEAMRAIAASEGVRGLYKGLGASVAAIIPEAAITYGLHDVLKRVYRQFHHQEPGVLTSLSFGVFAAFTGQLVSFPLETISRRLQVSSLSSGGWQATVAVTKDILSRGGVTELYRGVGAATLRLIPMAIVSFGTYEALRAALMYAEEQMDDWQARKEYEALHAYCSPLLVGGPMLGTVSAGASSVCALYRTAYTPCSPCKK